MVLHIIVGIIIVIIMGIFHIRFLIENLTNNNNSSIHAIG